MKKKHKGHFCEKNKLIKIVSKKRFFSFVFSVANLSLSYVYLHEQRYIYITT